MVLPPKTPPKSNGVILPLWLQQAIRERIEDIGDFEHRGVLQCFIHEERSEASIEWICLWTVWTLICRKQNGSDEPTGPCGGVLQEHEVLNHTQPNKLHTEQLHRGERLYTILPCESPLCVYLRRLFPPTLRFYFYPSLEHTFVLAACPVSAHMVYLKTTPLSHGPLILILLGKCTWTVEALVIIAHLQSLRFYGNPSQCSVTWQGWGTERVHGRLTLPLTPLKWLCLYFNVEKLCQNKWWLFFCFVFLLNWFFFFFTRLYFYSHHTLGS